MAGTAAKIIVSERQQILLKDMPWVPLYRNTELFLLSKGAEGFRSNAYQYYDYRRVNKESIRAFRSCARAW